jgi:hypothetical protein
MELQYGNERFTLNLPAGVKNGTTVLLQLPPAASAAPTAPPSEMTVLFFPIAKSMLPAKTSSVLTKFPLLHAENALLDKLIDDEGDPNETVTALGFVKRRAINDLHMGRPISDDIVYEWVRVFRNCEVKSHAPSFAVFDDAFYEILMSQTDRYCYEKVRLHTLKYGDVFALDRLFFFLFVKSKDNHNVPVTVKVQKRIGFAMVDVKKRSLSYYDAFGPRNVAFNIRVISVLRNLRRWLCDEHLKKRGVSMSETDWTIFPTPKDHFIDVSRKNYNDDGIFAIKGVHCLALGEALAFTDELIQPLRRCIEFEILSGRMANENNNVKRRHLTNMLTFIWTVKLLVYAIRARKRIFKDLATHLVHMEGYLTGRSEAKKVIAAFTAWKGLWNKRSQSKLAFQQLSRFAHFGMVMFFCQRCLHQWKSFALNVRSQKNARLLIREEKANKAKIVNEARRKTKKKKKVSNQDAVLLDSSEQKSVEALANVSLGIQEASTLNAPTSVASALACVVCFKNHSEFAVVPCGHRCLCEECADKVAFKYALCPMCRKEATMIIRIYG